MLVVVSSSSSSISPPSSSLNHSSAAASDAAMRRRLRTTFLLVSTVVFALLYLHLHLLVDRSSSGGDGVGGGGGGIDRVDLPSPLDRRVIVPRLPIAEEDRKYSIAEPEVNISRGGGVGARSVVEEAVGGSSGAAAALVAILFPDWEVFVVADPLSAGPGDELHCVFQNNATSPARFAGVLPFSNRATFVCELPISARRIRPFYQPLLTRSPIGRYPPVDPDRPPEELFRATFLAYETLSTEEDVVLFAKGVNNRQGTNRPPSEFNCVFFADGEDPSAGVRTAVTSSGQEVFRCGHPELTPTAWGGGAGEETKRIKVTLEIPREEKVLPTVAYYAPRPASPPRAAPSKSLTCASTMVHNVAKFLREWVVYHSRIGVERFVLYDNGSDDGLGAAVEELNRDGYDVRTILWPWPKTQEAGFSHSALYHNDSCTWMMYLDVDEFVYAPSWDVSNQPSGGLIRSSILPQNRTVGQVSINCNEYGPSGRKSHPTDGVTQGYTCRRRFEQRHKSVVRLDVVDPSLLNAIHHFTLAPGYRTKHIGLEGAVVNHYKYQAWPEFRNKFRRRVSAYVVDWTKAVNLMSKDRTPGLGFEPIEPKDWANSFCEVTDVRLRQIILKWFGTRTGSGYIMPW